MMLKKIENADAEFVSCNTSKNNRLFFMTCMSLNVYAYTKLLHATQAMTLRISLSKAMFYF